MSACFPSRPRTGTTWQSLIETAKRPVKVLNLFGYTGLASLVAARAGAEVTHVDASKKAIGWARENQEIAGLQQKPIRWICEDAMKFAEREERRGSHYDIVLFDPPAYGRGPKGEVWQLFDDLPALTDLCRADPDAEAARRRAHRLFDPRLVLRDPCADARHLRRHGRDGRIRRTDHPREGGRARAFHLAVFALDRAMSTHRADGAPGQVKEVTSLANPLVKDIKALALKKFRDEQGAFIAEGLKLVIDALDLGWSIRTLVFAKSARGNPAVEKAAARTVAAGGDRARSVGKDPDGDHAPRQSADGGRRLRAATHAAQAMSARPAATSGWRSTGFAIPAISAPSSAPSTRSARRASSWSATPPIPFSLETVRATMGSIFAVPVAKASQEAFLAWRKGFSGTGRRNPSEGCGRLPVASTTAASRSFS